MPTPRSAESKAGDLIVEIPGEHRPIDDPRRRGVRAWSLLENMITQLKDRSGENPFHFSEAARNLESIISKLRSPPKHFRRYHDRMKLYRDMQRNVEAVLDVVEQKRLGRETRSHRERDRERERATRGSRDAVDNGLLGLRISLETCLEQADDFEEALEALLKYSKVDYPVREPGWEGEPGWDENA